MSLFSCVSNKETMMSTKTKIKDHLKSQSITLNEGINRLLSSDELGSVKLLEIKIVGSNDLTVFALSEDGEEHFLDDLMTSIIPFNFIEELHSSESDYNQILLDSIVFWIQETCITYRNSLPINIVVMESDGISCFWLNESRWIKRTDDSYLRFFGIN